MHGLIAPTINVLILVGIFAYFLRTPLKQFVRGRYVNVKDDVERVSQQLRQSQERYEEFTAKLRAIDAEITALREQARQDAEAMRVRVRNDASKLAGTIVSDARASAGSLYTEFRGQLRTELANRVLERAEALLRERLTGDDRLRIRREFSRQVEAIQ